jgi:hypothetical protein
VFLSCMWIFMQLQFSAIRKSWIAFNMNKNKHPPRSNVEGCGCTTHWTDSEGSDIMVPSDRKL